MSDDQRAHELIQKHLDQTANAEELAELDRLVSESPKVAVELLEASRVDVLLTLHYQSAATIDVASSAPSKSVHARRWAFAGLAAAAVVLLLGILGWWTQGAAASHRVLTGVVEVDGRPVRYLRDNTPLRVTDDGGAVIELADGSRAELDPASEAVIRTHNPATSRVVELRKGGGRFRVRHGANDFRVETASGSVTALGTDFGVNLWSTQGKGDEEMSFRSMFVLAVAVLAGIVEVEVPGGRCMLPAGSRRVFAGEAEPTKSKNMDQWLPPGNVLGFTVKGQPFSLERNLPGIQGALDLTVEQKQKIASAMQETLMSETVRTAMATAKLDPNATQAQKNEARRLVDEAGAKLKELVAEILTIEQKALVEKISAATKEVQDQILGSMQSDLATAKGNAEQIKQLEQQMRQKMKDEFRSRAAAMFSPAQQTAFEKAANIQAAAEKAAKDNPNKGK